MRSYLIFASKYLLFGLLHLLQLFDLSGNLCLSVSRCYFVYRRDPVTPPALFSLLLERIRANSTSCQTSDVYRCCRAIPFCRTPQSGLPCLFRCNGIFGKACLPVTRCYSVYRRDPVTPPHCYRSDQNFHMQPAGICQIESSSEIEERHIQSYCIYRAIATYSVYSTFWAMRIICIT